MNRCCASVVAGALCLIALAGVRPASAQALGVKAGMTFTTQHVTPSDALGDVRQKSGLLAGGFVTWREDGKWTLEVGGQLALRRTAFGSGFSEEIEDKLTYVEVPVVVRYPVARFGARTVSALAGGSVNFLISAKETFLGETFDYSEAYESIDAAAVVGALLTWNNRWSFEGRYLFGLTETYVEADFTGLKTRQNGFQISAGYRFR